MRVQLRSRARRLFEQEKLTYEHDFTVWTGESEFYPLVEPRNFVPTYFESFYAPAFGGWYQYGGLHGDLAANRPNVQEPPRGHPLRRAMELLDEVSLMPNEADRIERFKAVQDIAADNLWTISIASPPPQLVVVKNGFRNVPRTALFGANFQSPANTGIETYFWEQPASDPAIHAQTKAAIATVTPWPGSIGYDADRGDSTLRQVLRGLILSVIALALVLVALRHPLIGRRLLLMVPTMGVVSVIVFGLVQLPPGDFAEIRVQRLELEGTASSAELAAELRRNFRLDLPMWQRYAHWMGFTWFTSFQSSEEGLLQGNLGLSSMRNRRGKSSVTASW